MLEEIRKQLSYDPETGIVTRLKDGSAMAVPKTSFLGTHIQITHIIWVLMYGRWPEEEIDHRDKDRSNNKFSNLRECTRTSNMQNRRWNNPNGKGVTFRGEKPIGRQWQAQIQVNKKKMQLGFYATAEEAAEAYRQAALEHHGEFACLE